MDWLDRHNFSPHAIRTCTGVFCASPALTLCIEEGLLLLLSSSLPVSRSTCIHFMAFHGHFFNEICIKPMSHGANAHIRCFLDRSLSHVVEFHRLLPTFSYLSSRMTPPPSFEIILKLLYLIRIYATFFVHVLSSLAIFLTSL